MIFVTQSQIHAHTSLGAQRGFRAADELANVI